MVIPERLMPASRASDWATPTPTASRYSRLSSWRELSGAACPEPTAFTRASERRRTRSPANRIIPLMVRKMAAASGLANRVRSWCSKARPSTPTGMVPMMISQASRSSDVSARRLPRVRKKAAMMRAQSLR